MHAIVPAGHEAPSAAVQARKASTTKTHGPDPVVQSWHIPSPPKIVGGGGDRDGAGAAGGAAPGLVGTGDCGGDGGCGREVRGGGARGGNVACELTPRATWLIWRVSATALCSALPSLHTPKACVGVEDLTIDTSAKSAVHTSETIVASSWVACTDSSSVAAAAPESKAVALVTSWTAACSL